MYTRMTAAAAGILLAAMTGATASASTATFVPCGPEALAGAISGAASGATLALTPHCTYVLEAALPQVSKDLTINGNNAVLERDGGATPAFVILTLADGTVTLNDVSFRNGRNAITVTSTARLTVNGGVFTGNTAQNGGAIADTGGFSPVINGATFTGNSAAGDGGAVYDNVPGDGMSVSGSTFTGNTAGQDGGSVWEFDLGGALSDSKFRGNSASGAGGGIWVSSDDGEELTGDSIRNNTAGGDGGGVFGASGGNAGLGVTGNTISDNRAGGNGGGVWLPGTGEPSFVTSSTLRGNSAANGGAIYDDTDSFVEISGDDIVDNHASASGGGLYDNSPGDSGDLSIGSTTLSANHAGGRGGGLFNSTASVPVTGSSVTGNLAGGGGGGIYDDVTKGASATLTSSQVTRNRPDNCQPAGSVTGCTG